MLKGGTVMDEQLICMGLDLMGYEQDGNGLDFICVHTGERKTFGSWREASDFLTSIAVDGFPMI